MAGRGNGRGREHGPVSLPTSATRTPTRSAPSVRPMARVQRSCCHGPTPKQCSCISTRSAKQSPKERMVWCSWPRNMMGRMAHHGQTQNAEEPDRHSAAIALAGTEPGGEHLAIHARQLAFKPRLRKLRCHTGSWLRRLEQAYPATRNHYLNRTAKMGAHRSILIAAGISTAFLVGVFGKLLPADQSR